MTGHGAKLGRKMEQAVIALLTARNLEEAAKSVGVSTKTLLRWQKLPQFDRAFREAKTVTFRQSLARLQQASGPAVTTLLKILVDPGAQLAVKARCAYYILDQTRKGMETEEIESRVAALETAAASGKHRQ
jgi:hypothetical protein